MGSRECIIQTSYQPIASNSVIAPEANERRCGKSTSFRQIWGTELYAVFSLLWEALQTLVEFVGFILNVVLQQSVNRGGL